MPSIWITSKSRPERSGEAPVFLYFHGNGGSLRWREERFRALISDGSGLVALSYRGYGGSSGRPTEKGLSEDAAAAYAFAVARYPAQRIVLWGESLGSALAIALGAEKPVGCLVLEAPFTSAVDVGAWHYWFVPVRLLMKDRFRSDLCAGNIKAPVLVAHGESDTIVPITLGKRLSTVRIHREVFRSLGTAVGEIDRDILVIEPELVCHPERAIGARQWNPIYLQIAHGGLSSELLRSEKRIPSLRDRVINRLRSVQ